MRMSRSHGHNKSARAVPPWCACQAKESCSLRMSRSLGHDQPTCAVPLWCAVAQLDSNGAVAGHCSLCGLHQQQRHSCRTSNACEHVTVTMGDCGRCVCCKHLGTLQWWLRHLIPACSLRQLAACAPVVVRCQYSCTALLHNTAAHVYGWSVLEQCVASPGLECIYFDLCAAIGAKQLSQSASVSATSTSCQSKDSISAPCQVFQGLYAKFGCAFTFLVRAGCS
jgi:hypothetical protein